MATKSIKPKAEISDVSEATRREIDTLYLSTVAHVRKSCDCALKAGLRLLYLYHASQNTEGGFLGVIEKMESGITRATAYRWLNAAAGVLMRHHRITDPQDLIPPAPGTKDFAEAEAILQDAAEGTSISRLLLGSTAKSDPERLDELVTKSENGDIHAAEALERVERGELTLVQAIRAAAGAAATKEKTRHDPVYLDLDGATGQPRGLFPKALITLSNTFARWGTLDPSARAAAKASWKATVASLPAELR